MVLLSGCGTSASTSTAAPAVVQSTALGGLSPTPTGVDRLFCELTDDGGSYYLLVDSAGFHNFDVCTGGKPYIGDLDGLFKMPGMDRRCILPNSYVIANHASVAVYADAKKANFAAAEAFCKANKGTENGD